LRGGRACAQSHARSCGPEQRLDACRAAQRHDACRNSARRRLEVQCALGQLQVEPVLPPQGVRVLSEASRLCSMSAERLVRAWSFPRGWLGRLALDLLHPAGWMHGIDINHHPDNDHYPDIDNDCHRNNWAIEHDKAKSSTIRSLQGLSSWSLQAFGKQGRVLLAPTALPPLMRALPLRGVRWPAPPIAR